MTGIGVATSADLDRIAELHAEANDAHHLRCPSVFATGQPHSAHRDLLRPYLDTEGAVLLAARAGTGAGTCICGYACVQLVQESSPLFKPARFGRIESLGVAMRSRGQGVGRALMDAAERWALGLGATEVHLNVWSVNTVALRLYRAMGYEARAHYMAKALPIA